MWYVILGGAVALCVALYLAYRKGIRDGRDENSRLKYYTLQRILAMEPKPNLPSFLIDEAVRKEYPRCPPAAGLGVNIGKYPGKVENGDETIKAFADIRENEDQVFYQTKDFLENNGLKMDSYKCILEDGTVLVFIELKQR